MYRSQLYLNLSMEIHLMEGDGENYARWDELLEQECSYVMGAKTEMSS